MELKIGDKYGCLEVVGGCEEAEADIVPIIKQLAEKEWNKFEYSCYRILYNFYEYFELSEEETNAYYNKDSMPITFIDKFRNHYRDFENVEMFLYHDQHPNTSFSLLTAIREKQLYKVRCNKCGKIYYMDDDSITCVNWLHCKNPDCSNKNPANQISDYSKSLYTWHSDKNELQVLNQQLAVVDQLENSLSYYGNDSRIRISYISDMHLSHHLKYYDNDEEKMIGIIGDRLYYSSLYSEIVIFDGDISSKRDLTIKLLKYFVRRSELYNFKTFKNDLATNKRYKIQLSRKSWYEEALKKLNHNIEKLKVQLLPEFDFVKFEKYKAKYRAEESNESAFDYFKTIRSFTKLNLPELTIEKIALVIKLMDLSGQYCKHIEEYESKKIHWRFNVEYFEREYNKPVEEITLLDYKHSFKDNIYVVLGNHDYIDFKNVNEGVEYFREQLSKLGITLLHNDYKIGNEYLIYGGTGFAKYDENWNANRVICCKGFSREDEIKETDAFEKGYYDALAYAKKHGLCFICASHYPASACLNNHYDKEAIYFTGHTHINEFIKNEEKVVYADNQIGYKDNDFRFRTAITGVSLNPYGELSDGLYQTTLEDYLAFYRYIAKRISKGAGLNQSLHSGKTFLYVLKRRGYYGFFMVRTKGNSRGIFILDGGKNKKITESTDIMWICDNFDIVLSKYLKSLLPLRRVQKKLSKELKELGLKGTIHGTIVDIDYYHHIMLNPYENSLNYYYSPQFGSIESLGSFDNVIKSLGRTGHSEEKLKLIQQKYNSKAEQSGYLLSTMTDNSMIDTSLESDSFVVPNVSLQFVSRSKGMYGISRKVSPLQCLFEGHVLRNFDISLVETKPKPFRQTLYNGKRFRYDSTEYVVVEDDGTEMIVAEIVDEKATKKIGCLQLTGVRESFSITALKSIFSKEYPWRYGWIQ